MYTYVHMWMPEAAIGSSFSPCLLRQGLSVDLMFTASVGRLVRHTQLYAAFR